MADSDSLPPPPRRAPDPAAGAVEAPRPSDVEARARAIAATLSDGLVVLEAVPGAAGDPVDWRYLDANDSILELLGRARDEVVGKTVRDVVPDRFTAVHERLARVLASGEPDRYETTFRGRALLVKLSRVDLRTVASAAVDITDRKRAEEALRDSERRAMARAAELQAVLDTVPAAVWIARDPMADRIDSNRFGAELLALAPGTNVSVTSPSADRPTSFVPMRDGLPIPPDELPIQAAAQRGVEIRDFELDLAFADGSVRHLLGNAAPIRDPGGEARGSVGAFIDITERRRAELRAEALARFPEENPDPVLRLAPDLTVSYANDAGRAALAGLGGSVGAHAPPALADAARAAIAAGGRLVVEIASGRKALSLNFVLAGTDVNVYGHDVTDLRAAEQALRESDRRKTEFLAVLSHELRNPLAPILTGVEILETSAPGSAVAARARAIIRRQTEHLARLVDDLLDVTRVSRGKIELRRVRLDLRDVVRRTVDDHREQLGGRSIALEVALPPEPVWLHADATRMAQVVGNVLHNAAKFTPAGGAVCVTLSARGRYAELAVRDTGIGIDAQDLPRLFEPFAQGDQGLARSAGGLGLGLALVKGLVELHGGRVRAASDGPGRGAEIAVSLPLAEGEPAALPGAPREAAPAGRDVLVIEDNEDAATTLADLLELSGHRVRVARDGRTGLALAQERIPDVIFCDIGLPDMDGYDVARAVRAVEALRSVRLVALTGYAQPDDRRRAAAAGFDVHLAKPPPAEEIAAALR